MTDAGQTPRSPGPRARGFFREEARALIPNRASRTAEWKAPGAVLLISCYELGRQPLALASPMAFLREAGFQPRAMDVAAEDFCAERVARAKFVGISVPMHTALRLGVEVAARVRGANPGSHICFYGLYALLNKDYLLENGADSAIGGEFEWPLLQLIEGLSRSAGAAEVPGAATRGRASGPYLEKIPPRKPARDGLPGVRAYAHLVQGGERYPAGAVEASRGCKHLCLHCPVPPVYGGRFFIVPRERVLEDVEDLVARGARHISFADPDFLNGPTHAVRLTREMHERFPALTFDFTAKVAHLVRHAGLLPRFRESGCAFFVTAVESLSDRVLKYLDKGHAREDVFRLVRAAREARVSIRPSLVAFTPWTRAEDYFDLLDFIEEHALIDEVDPVQMAIRLLVPPGSCLLDSAHMREHIRGLDPENFIHRWEHPDPRMDRLHEEALPLVEDAAARREDAAATFLRLRRLAADILERPARSRPKAVFSPERVRPPRLSESWFC